MAAQLMYVWYYVAPNTTASVFIHGFSDQEAVVFSATGAWETEEFGGGPLKVRQDEVYRHGVLRTMPRIEKSIFL